MAVEKSSYNISEEDRHFMRMASNLALQNVKNGGGPFGAVIVREGRIVATGVNSVTKSNDPTAHAEINAIRNACETGETFRLTGCTVYSSCEPCPMCLSALYWAGVERIFYGNTKEDAASIEFDDHFIYRQLAKPTTLRAIPQIHVADRENIRAFEMWMNKSDKIKY